MFKGAIKSEFVALPAATGYIIVCVPTRRHVKALQTLLGPRISQEEAVDWDTFNANPEAYPDKSRLIFMEAHTTSETIAKMPPRMTFLAAEVFVLAGSVQLMALRDQTGCKWGDLEKRISSDSVFEGFAAALAKTE
jgi:hypothetical protein